MTVTTTAELVQHHGLTAPPEGPLVPHAILFEFARTLREELGFAFLTYITASHHLEVPSKTKGDVVEPAVPAYYMVAYRVRNLEKNLDFPFRCKVDLGTSVPSLCRLWAGADWQERECFDLVGPVFEGHPDLRRIMMPEDWEGHPLHRDYPIDTPHKPWR